MLKDLGNLGLVDNLVTPRVFHKSRKTLRTRGCKASQEKEKCSSTSLLREPGSSSGRENIVKRELRAQQALSAEQKVASVGGQFTPQGKKAKTSSTSFPRHSCSTRRSRKKNLERGTMGTSFPVQRSCRGPSPRHPERTRTCPGKRVRELSQRDLELWKKKCTL